MSFKLNDKVRLLTEFYEDEDLTQSIPKGSILTVVADCRTLGQWIDQTSVQLDFLNPPYNHENEFELVEEEKVQLKVPKFCRGDKVILTNPKADSGHGLEEGWIGYVLSPNDGSDEIPVQVATEESNLVYYYFDEDELELLSAAKPDIKHIKVRHDSVGLSLDDPLMKITPSDFVGSKGSALDKQIGGGHYKSKGIQPIEYIFANNLGFCESNIVKYATRWKDKNGIQDLEKIIHYAELLIELTKKEESKNKEGK